MSEIVICPQKQESCQEPCIHRHPHLRYRLCQFWCHRYGMDRTLSCKPVTQEELIQFTLDKI